MPSHVVRSARNLRTNRSGQPVDSACLGRSPVVSNCMRGEGSSPQCPSHHARCADRAEEERPCAIEREDRWPAHLTAWHQPPASWRALLQFRWPNFVRAAPAHQPSDSQSRSGRNCTSMCTITTPGGQEKTAANSMDAQPALLTNAPLCLARNRAGNPCRCPALKGKARCKLHGGKSPGAPKGERNGAWKHGGDTNEAIALRQAASRLIRAIRNG